MRAMQRSFETERPSARAVHRARRRRRWAARALTLAAGLVLALGQPRAEDAAGATVHITHDLHYVEVMHKGQRVRIERHPDTDNMIDPDFSLTSRPCPPYCIQPMTLAAGVETLGELELIDYLRRQSAGDPDVMVIDSRDGDWPQRSGVIPGAIVLPWDRLFLARNDPEDIAEILETRFGAQRDGPLWNFARAKTLVFYCNGPWCGQSPTNIKTLLNLGYPAAKLKWYRGGMQVWKSLGLTTVAP